MDIFSFDLISVPIHLKVHWVTVTQNLFTMTMGGSNPKCFIAIKNYLADEAKENTQTLEHSLGETYTKQYSTAD